MSNQFVWPNSPSAAYSKKEDWNAIVRKNTIARDPIGSTRNSITRKDKRNSLRRQILEEANQGLKMDTDKIVGKFVPDFADTLFRSMA